MYSLMRGRNSHAEDGPFNIILNIRYNIIVFNLYFSYVGEQSNWLHSFFNKIKHYFLALFTHP